MPRKNKTNQISREYLLKAFVSLLQTEPYSDINITDITSAAGVSRMAYYRNYTSKDEILTLYFDELAASIVHPLNDYLPVPKNMAEYMVLLFKRLAADAYANEYNLGLALENAGLGGMFLENITKNLRTFFPPVGEKANAELSLIAGAFYGIYMQWSKAGQPENVSLLSDVLFTFLSR